jgi:beta-glucanase (GH16 family)
MKPKPRIRIAIATLGLVTAALGGIQPAAARAASWSDDFTGPAGSAPDSAKWGYDIGNVNNGWGNQELEYYTNSRNNSRLDGNGNLVITARADDAAQYQCFYGTCRYTSARLLTKTKFTQQYGTFEIRAKIPRGQGLWPAFWMLGSDIDGVGWPNCGEIDVMENIGREPNTVHGSLHGPGYSGGNPITGTYSLPGGAAFADGFHTFAVQWSPNAISWSVDGQVYQTKTPADAGGNHWAFDHPFFLIMNVAVGGTWPGSPDGSTQFPQEMVVDYVHVS